MRLRTQHWFPSLVLTEDIALSNPDQSKSTHRIDRTPCLSCYIHGRETLSKIIGSSRKLLLLIAPAQNLNRVQSCLPPATPGCGLDPPKTLARNRKNADSTGITITPVLYVLLRASAMCPGAVWNNRNPIIYAVDAQSIH
jgi:hypothetical protein